MKFKLFIDLHFFSVPPEIIDAESSTSTVNIRENYNASLICKATGTPEPEITWKREDGRKIVIKRKKNNGKKGNKAKFSNFSCRFINPNYFFQSEL